MSIHDKRELNKVGLEMFNLNKQNKFDNAINKLVIDLQKNFKECENNIDKYFDNDPSEVNTYINLLYIYEEELISIMEMKIIYAFKVVETDIKILINGAFKNVNKKDLYRWEVIIAVLHSKNIDVTKFSSYQNTFQLKQVNNAIKHSALYHRNLNDIPEFKTSEKYISNKLLAFYNRVKDSAEEFIEELKSAIFDELYKFNDEKLNDIAESLVLRMSKEDAEILAKKMLSYYK